MQLLLKCMADHHNHELIQTYSIGALMNIVNSSDSILVPAGRSGVIAAVMDAMRTHQENAELQMVGLRTMTRLAHSKQNRKVVEKSGGKELTRRAIEVHKGNPMVEEAANEMKKYLKTWDDDSDDDTAN
jgi:threonine dehydratase